MITRSANSGRSLYQLQGRRATIVLLMLLFSVVSVDAAYTGVATRNRGVSFYCEVYFVGVSPTVKVWVGTYRTEELAALACDVAFFYTNRPSEAFNLEDSEDKINLHCKPRSAYDSLNSWEERKGFIKAEANALLHKMSSQDDDTDFRTEDVDVPPLVPVRQRPVDVPSLSCTIVQHFLNQPEQLREFMEWLKRLTNDPTQLTHQVHVQTVIQQPSEETVSQYDVEEAPPVEDEQFLDTAQGHDQTDMQQSSEESESESGMEAALRFGHEQLKDAARVWIDLESFEARPDGASWLTIVASSLPLLFHMFTTNNAHDIEDASSTTNKASITEQERCQSTTKPARKRQKVNQPSSSIELDPEQEDLFTATPLDVKYEEWQCTGYEMGSKKWRKLPPFSFLPDQYSSPFKKYSICGHDSLMCVNISTLGADLVVFNPLTGKKRPLPPLLFPRHPVLLHMLVDSVTKSYRVIVAGSSRSDEEHLSKKMEVFDSKTSKWEEMHDIPGPAFGLIEAQAGVCANGVLYFISFLEGDVGKGVVAFDVENGKWLPNMTCPIPHLHNFHSLKIFHLVENNGEIYLFYKLKGKPENKHCIDVLELSNSASEEVRCHWRNVVRVNCGRRFKRYREYMCVGFGEGKLCIFDTVEVGAVVYDVRSGQVSEVLESFRDERSVFHALNPSYPYLQ